MTDRVTIGVPIYRGERFLEETLQSIRRQTYTAFDVIMSLDGPDPACEAICTRFLDDPRFRLVIQPQRLGWVEHFNWLARQTTNPFWCYHQQDDLTDERYLEVLVDHARRHPGAALVYCDVVPMGRIGGEPFRVAPVTGLTAFARVMIMLLEHFPAMAFRGLTRAAALHGAGPVPTNAVNNFGVDITWVTGIARQGELHRVPLPLYRKRYHDNNTESPWWTLPHEERLRPWAHHCVDMLGEALRLDSAPDQMRLLWHAAVTRLTAPGAAAHYLDLDALTIAQRRALLDMFLAQAGQAYRHSLPALLDAPWATIARWTRRNFWVPASDELRIESFGPNPVVCGRPFNALPDGRSALWLRLSAPVSSRCVIRCGGVDLETGVNGNLVSGIVPPEVTARPGRVPLTLIGPDGKPRCPAVMLDVIDGGPPHRH